MTDQLPLLHDTPEESLVALVFALGGWQRAAAVVWPTENPISQGDKLRRVLTGQGRDRLTLREWIALFRAGAKAGCHVGAAGVMRSSGYAVDPLDPDVEEARALQAVDKAATALTAALEVLERARDRA